MDEESQNDRDEVADAMEAGPPAVEKTDLITQRMADLIDDSLAKEDSLEAMLGVIIADLMQMGQQLNGAIGQGMDSKSPALEDIEDRGPAMDRYLRLVKQIQGLSQLKLQLSRRST